MKTKLLLAAAAVMAVGAGTSMAQVYSANAVGYVNLSLPGPTPPNTTAFAILGNPLNNTNNNLSTILAAAPNNTRVYRFDPTLNAGLGGYVSSTRLVIGWQPNLTFNPGEGFFIQYAAPLNLTFVGEVPQGALSNPLTGNNTYQMRSSQVPQALPLGRPASAPGTSLEFPAAGGDAVYQFTAPNGPYVTHNYNGTLNQWLGPASNGGNGPTIPVATGFFLRKSGAASQAWTRNFSVN
jgi:hypothetical protein